MNGSSAKSGIARHDDVTSVRIEAADGGAVELSLTPALEVWTAPASREDASQGFIIVPIMRAEGETSASVTVQLTPAPHHAEPVVAESEDEGYDEEDELDEDDAEENANEDRTIVPGDSDP